MMILSSITGIAYFTIGLLAGSSAERRPCREVHRHHHNVHCGRQRGLRDHSPQHWADIGRLSRPLVHADRGRFWCYRRDGMAVAARLWRGRFCAASLSTGHVRHDDDVTIRMSSNRTTPPTSARFTTEGTVSTGWTAPQVTESCGHANDAAPDHRDISPSDNHDDGFALASWVSYIYSGV
jgi:hypothetical protein